MSKVLDAKNNKSVTILTTNHQTSKLISAIEVVQVWHYRHMDALSQNRTLAPFCYDEYAKACADVGGVVREIEKTIVQPVLVVPPLLPKL